MKLPLWCKGKDGKYHRFPYESLQTLPNGGLGVPFDYYRYSIIVKLCEETGWPPSHFFDYIANLDAYALKGEIDE